MTQLSFDRTSLREQEEGMNTYDSASKSSKTNIDVQVVDNQDAVMYQSFNNGAAKTIRQSDIKFEENDEVRQQSHEKPQNDSSRKPATPKQQEQIIEIRNQQSRGDQIQSLSVVKLNIKRDSVQNSDYIEEPISRIEVVIENK